MIDLHTHTTESDGSRSPLELLQLANHIGLEALAITDHDTFSGYDQAKNLNHGFHIELICGVELSTHYNGRSVHLLAYFISEPPTLKFRSWVEGLQTGRHVRNEKLIAKLRSMGFDVTLKEVARLGKKLPGRPHFASLLVEKGYAASIQEAFDKYLDENATCFVPRDEPAFEEAIERIIESKGLSSLAHPIRISRAHGMIEEIVGAMRMKGLQAIEVFHSDHSPEEASFYNSLAQRYSLAVTGGSDFHGNAKPHIALGTGRQNNLNLSFSILEQLKSKRD